MHCILVDGEIVQCRAGGSNTSLDHSIDYLYSV